MDFRRNLVANGVSAAGAEEAFLGLPITNAVDQNAVRRLGYYVSPQGEMTPAKALGPGSSLPKHWLESERPQAFRGNYRERAAAQKGAKATLQQIGRLDQLGSEVALVGGKSTKPTSASETTLAALMGQAKALTGPGKADGKAAADAARKAQILKLEQKIAAVKAKIDAATRALNAELAKEIGIYHLANPITFPFFLVVYEQWKRRVQALQKELMELITQLPALYAELFKLKSS